MAAGMLEKHAMKNIRIAVITACFRVGRTRENLKTLSRWTAAAAKKKADVVCFPEMCVTGYCSGPEIRKWAEPLPGPSTAFLEDLAREHCITILAGMAEIDTAGLIYASHLVFGPEGLIGIYRKLHLGPPEKAVLSPGEAIPLFTVPQFTFGIQLCYDAHFPELATAMAVKGADALFIPHASPGRTAGSQKAIMASPHAGPGIRQRHVCHCLQPGGGKWPGTPLSRGHPGDRPVR